MSIRKTTIRKTIQKPRKTFRLLKTAQEGKHQPDQQDEVQQHEHEEVHQQQERLKDAGDMFNQWADQIWSEPRGVHTTNPSHSRLAAFLGNISMKSLPSALDLSKDHLRVLTQIEARLASVRRYYAMLKVKTGVLPANRAAYQARVRGGMIDIREAFSTLTTSQLTNN